MTACARRLRPGVGLLLFFALAWAAAPSDARAVSTALVVAIDTSGTIDNGEFALQRQAYADFFSTNAAAFDTRDVAVTVMYWAGDGIQTQAVPWTTLDSAGDAQGFASSILATSRPDISPSAGPDAAMTGVAQALGFATNLFSGQSFGTADLVIDISGDGTENLDTDMNIVLDTVTLDVPGFGPADFDVTAPWGSVLDPAAGARQAALAADILINALALNPIPADPGQPAEAVDGAPAVDFFPAPMVSVGGNPVDVSAQWQAALTGLYGSQTLLELFYGRVIGAPMGDPRSPLLVVGNGFSAAELSDRIGFKLGQELGIPVPEPGTALLVGAGLLLAAARRRRA